MLVHDVFAAVTHRSPIDGAGLPSPRGVVGVLPPAAALTLGSLSESDIEHKMERWLHRALNADKVCRKTRETRGGRKEKEVLKLYGLYEMVLKRAIRAWSGIHGSRDSFDAEQQGVWIPHPHLDPSGPLPAVTSTVSISFGTSDTSAAWAVAAVIWIVRAHVCHGWPMQLGHGPLCVHGGHITDISRPWRAPRPQPLVIRYR